MASEKFQKCRKTALRCRKNALTRATASPKLVMFATPPQLDRGGLMSRRIRAALSLLLVSFALSAAACADATAPSADTTCDHNNPATCR
jgi:hypothetical protein